MKNIFLSLAIKNNKSAEFQSRLSGLVLMHLIIVMSMGILNLLMPILNIDLSGFVLIWMFILGIIFFHFITQSILLGERRTLLINRTLFTIIFFFFCLFLWRIIQVYWSNDEIETLKAAIKTALLGVFVVSIYNGFTHITNNGMKKIAVIVPSVLLLLSLFAYIWLLSLEGGFSLYGERNFKISITLYGGSNTAASIILLLGLWNWINIFSNSLIIKSLGICNIIITIFLLIGIASYSSLAGFIASVILLSLLLFWEKKRNLLLFIIFAVFGLTIIVFFLSEYVLISDRSLDEKLFRTGYQRIVLWAEAWDALKDGAWLNGLGSATYAEPSTIFSEPLRGGIHNALLQSWLEGGLVELVLHLGLYIWLIKMAIKHFCKEGIVLLCALSGMFVRNLAESNGILFGLINNFSVFLSWYIVIFFLILLKDFKINQRLRKNFKGVQTI